MPQPDDVARLRSRRDTALMDALKADARVRALDAAIARAERSAAPQEAAQLRTDRAVADQAAQAAHRTHAQLSQDAIAGLAAWLGQTPEQIVGALSEDRKSVV